MGKSYSTATCATVKHHITVLGWEVKVPLAHLHNCSPESTTLPLPLPPPSLAAAAVSLFFTSFSALPFPIPPLSLSFPPSLHPTLNPLNSLNSTSS
ncbi:unnamed protein product, partial [Taenia asiatica]|uniref:Uncharacterized protein n=1 Tax=Taenia asiatica TaxID=60517 RepID=A0A0R3W071_TAEAS